MRVIFVAQTKVSLFLNRMCVLRDLLRPRLKVVELRRFEDLIKGEKRVRRTEDEGRRKRSELLEQQKQQGAKLQSLEQRLLKLSESKQDLAKQRRAARKRRKARCLICKRQFRHLDDAQACTDTCLEIYMEDAAEKEMARIEKVRRPAVDEQDELLELMDGQPAFDDAGTALHLQRTRPGETADYVVQYKHRPVRQQQEWSMLQPEPEPEPSRVRRRSEPPSPSMISRQGSYVQEFRADSRAARPTSPLDDFRQLSPAERSTEGFAATPPAHRRIEPDTSKWGYDPRWPGESESSDVSAARARVQARVAQTTAQREAVAAQVRPANRVNFACF